MTNTGNDSSGLFWEETVTVRLPGEMPDTVLITEPMDTPLISLPLTEWVKWENMSEELRAKHPEAKSAKRCLIQRTYHEAWAKAWRVLPETTKEEFKNLPNFCPEKFKRITGIDVENEEEK